MPRSHGARARVSERWSPGRSAKVELQRLHPRATEDPMTEDRMALVELLQKSGESDFLRAVAEAVLQILMEADVQGLNRRRPARTHRGSAQLPERLWRRGLDTRLGSLQLGIPKLHQGHLRNAPAQCQSQHTTVAAAMRQAFLQADAKTASVGRLNKQVKRRADVIGIFQKEASITPI